MVKKLEETRSTIERDEDLRQQYYERYGALDNAIVSKPVRYVSGLALSITALILVLLFMDTGWDLARISSIFFIICAIIASFTQGRVSQFFGSVTALAILCLTLFMVGHEVIDIINKESSSSLIQPIMALVAWGGGSLAYLLKRKFGFATEDKDSEEKSYEMDWYQVTFDADNIYFDVNPPAYRDWRKVFKKTQPEPWTHNIEWSDIEGVCFQAADLYASDEIWLKLKSTQLYHVVPTEAKGGSALWFEIMDRGLFPELLAIEAMGSIGELYCYPPITDKCQ